MMKHKENLIIENGKIVLKSLDREDSERYRILRNREENRKCFFTNTEISKEDQGKWFTQYYENQDEYMFSIYERNSGKYLGAVALYHIDHASERAEVGRLIVDQSMARGKGYGQEAVCCVIEWGKENLGIKTFYAQIYIDNFPSIKTFLKCGFLEKTHEGKVGDHPWLLMEKIIK